MNNLTPVLEMDDILKLLWTFTGRVCLQGVSLRMMLIVFRNCGLTT